MTDNNIDQRYVSSIHTPQTISLDSLRISLGKAQVQVKLGINHTPINQLHYGWHVQFETKTESGKKTWKTWFMYKVYDKTNMNEKKLIQQQCLTHLQYYLSM